MNTKNIFRAALSMTAAFMMTACSSDDINKVTPQSEGRIIPFEATVSGGALTRAAVDDDNQTLKFATGDKLYISGTNIKGVLDILTGTGTVSATFSGNLTYTGSGSPASDLALTATLVSAQQSDGTEIAVNANTGAVTLNYPTAAYCANVATAVQKYSNLTGTSTYGNRNFTLDQQTAFLNFVITFNDDTPAGATLSAVVSNGGSALCTANVTSVTESNNVVAKFVLPVAKGTTLSSATVMMDEKTVLAITDATLDGKVYNVNKTMVAVAEVTTAPTATTGDIIEGSTTTLVTAGKASGGTMMYAVTTTNTKPTSTEDFSDKVPTAASLAAGTYYVWYYAKADVDHTDSEISASGIAVIVKAATVAVTSVTLDKTELALTVGDAVVQLTATVAPEDATDKTVTWTSDKPAVATVDATGKVTAVAAGEATITAQAGDKTATCKVTVTKAPATITTAPTATTGDIIECSTTALVTAGKASGGTMMYAVTTTNKKPTSTEGFSATVPTAASLAAGTYYIWYYAKADADHTDSEISVSGIAVTVKAKPGVNSLDPFEDGGDPLPSLVDES